MTVEVLKRKSGDKRFKFFNAANYSNMDELLIDVEKYKEDNPLDSVCIENLESMDV